VGNEVKTYKQKFVSHLESLGVTREIAVIECEAHLESSGVDCLCDPVGDADECMTYWSE
jgi:hypothetical protein